MEIDKDINYDELCLLTYLFIKTKDKNYKEHTKFKYLDIIADLPILNLTTTKLKKYLNKLKLKEYIELNNFDNYITITLTLKANAHLALTALVTGLPGGKYEN